ncbi:efflux RND transporter periplasmic adaptor subunit [Synechocystis sp. LEGE 06083]|uniref:efflux RND transporter periplasmic adaptor subunit n=1 Tax=Synechocystis sp. LEGE 06083 TaxID=915336 RepID=UPI00187F6FEA|nr:efflux RND transporter periplasmic adaptor subunit [Synechocystis sp. LEGE 06083]MBE9193964.1 efflux RND transporter periplasmic adaptor subunit [Synechocystis sp. LEGE 06083]
MQNRIIAQSWALSLLLGVLVLSPKATLAHAGHGDEFHQSESAQSAQGVALDGDTIRRLEIKVEPLQPRSLMTGIRATGQIETLPQQRVEITTPVGGKLLELLVNPGESVTAGQVVAIMTSAELAELRTTAQDRRSLAIAAVEQAQADLQLAQENYRQQQRVAQSEIEEARLAKEFAQERYDRDRELEANGALPRRQLLESEVALATANADLVKVQSRLPVSEAVAQIKRAQTALNVAQKQVKLSEKTYQTRLQQLGTNARPDGSIVIKAPMTGIVIDPASTPEHEIKVGESRQDAGEPIFTIINSQQVQVSANIYEKDLNKIRQGQGIRGWVSSSPGKTFTGRINQIGSVVEGENRIVSVKATLDNADGQLKPGLFVELEVLTDRTPTPVLAVPQSAIVKTNDQQNLVFVQNGNIFEPITVTVGQVAGDWVEIKEGLFAGDLVVSQRASQLYAQSLRAKPSESEKVEETEQSLETKESTFPLPTSSGWLLPLVGIMAAAGIFWAGSLWGKRQESQPLRERTLMASQDEPSLEVEKVLVETSSHQDFS